MLGDEDHALWDHLRQDSVWRYGWQGVMGNNPAWAWGALDLLAYQPVPVPFKG
jgi:hypothetical protein